jgi:hypothetical protein
VINALTYSLVLEKVCLPFPCGNESLGLIKEKRKEKTTMAIRKLDVKLPILIGILGLFLFTPIVQAQTPFDVTECGGGPVTIVFQSPEVTVSGLEGKGIFFSNHENKLFNNSTFQVVQIARVIGSNRVSNSYWKIMDPDGDAIVASVDVVGPEKTMIFLHGTGKWKGIKGGAKGKGITGGKFIVPGTFQACSRYVGTFELVK